MIIHVNKRIYIVKEVYGHYEFIDYENGDIVCTCDVGELNETIYDLEI